MSIFSDLYKVMAERQGFEPWIPCGIHAFQACAFSHSAISPRFLRAFLNLTQSGLLRRRWPGLDLHGACASTLCFTMADDLNSTGTPCVRYRRNVERSPQLTCHP